MKPDTVRRVRSTAVEKEQRRRQQVLESSVNQVGSNEDGITSRPVREATRRRAKNGELRQDIAKTGGVTKAQQRIACLEEQNARIICIDGEVEQLRVEITGTPPGPSRRRLRQERDALLAERELMSII